jgi:hypothetical protein
MATSKILEIGSENFPLCTFLESQWILKHFLLSKVRNRANGDIFDLLPRKNYTMTKIRIFETGDKACHVL